MCRDCRVTKVGSRYYPVFPDGVPFGPGYATGELAYKVAEDAHVGFETPESGPKRFADRLAKELFHCYGTNLKERLMNSRPVDGPWHKLNGHKVKFCKLKGD